MNVKLNAPVVPSHRIQYLTLLPPYEKDNDMKTINYALKVGLCILTGALGAQAQSTGTPAESTNPTEKAGSCDDHVMTEADIQKQRQMHLDELERYYRENHDKSGFDQRAYDERLRVLTSPSPRGQDPMESQAETPVGQ